MGSSSSRPDPLAAIVENSRLVAWMTRASLKAFSCALYRAHFYANFRHRRENHTPLSNRGDSMADNDEDLKAEVERLRAENEALKEGAKKGLRLQVSAKGGVSLYGIRRFPITFYRDEWDTVLDMADEIRAFLNEHAGELKQKG